MLGVVGILIVFVMVFGGYLLAVTALDRGLQDNVLHWPALLAPVAVPVLDFVQVVSA